MSSPQREIRRQKRHQRVRLHLSGTGERPRLCVFRSLRHIYAQVVDDSSGRTLAAASTAESGIPASGVTCESAAAVGRAIGERASRAGVSKVVFDRGGYLYHGRVKALADAARSSGLEF